MRKLFVMSVVIVHKWPPADDVSSAAMVSAVGAVDHSGVVIAVVNQSNHIECFLRERPIRACT